MTPDRVDGLLPTPFTGIVVTLNESHRLRECLESLRFCDEIIVVDLGSTDDSVVIAEQCGARVVTHERLPIVEMIRDGVKEEARNDWLIFLDPDEVFPEDCHGDLSRLIGDRKDAATIMVPWRFYFKGRILTRTFWGQIRVKEAVVHWRRVRLKKTVHRGYEPLRDFQTVTLSLSGERHIKHFWMDSYRQLFEKHQRYIAHEGESRFVHGERFTWSSCVVETAKSLKRNLIDYRGILGGPRALFLSFFHGWYTFMSQLSLRSYQLRMR
jgi:glycosyltransferase involved in cell wall biosynthesis